MKKPSNLLCGDPFIATYEKIVTEQVCCELIDLAKKNQLEPSKILLGTVLNIEARNSHETLFQHDSREVVLQVCERIASIVKYPLNYAEQLKVLRYQVGGNIIAHYDAYPFTQLGRTTISQSGQPNDYCAYLFE